MDFINYDLIKNARKSKRITQEELAKHLNVNRATVSKYENGLISPPWDQSIKIAHFLGIPLNNLAGVETEIDEAGFVAETVMDELSQLQSFKDFSRAEIALVAMELVKNTDKSNTDVVGIVDSAISAFDSKSRIIYYFNSLNEEGQRVAADRVQELTEIPKYQAEK